MYETGDCTNHIVFQQFTEHFMSSIKEKEREKGTTLKKGMEKTKKEKEERKVRSKIERRKETSCIETREMS